ncbi:MAG: family 43 glycosylhydrolase [Clostridia bacterium]|nr:family 43 glycosylhydrolase [Clostridia bacterium]
MLAARSAGIDMVRYLVEYGLRVNLNSIDACGRDLLHYAAEGGDVGVCRYLVERGGMDPLRGDNTLTTPLDLAHRCGHTAVQAYFEEAVGCPLEQMYRNPICRGMHPDPSVVRVGDDYYMVNSTFVFFPCIPVSHSRDLVHWEVIGHAIENPEWANLEGLEGGRGYWAPDISYSNGRFYICATLRLNDVGHVRRRQMVVTSERPEGPYSEPVFFEEDGIDPSIFHDDDGRHYMLLNRGARIFEIDETATKRLSETTLLYYGSQKRAPEGPHLLKKDGWYYLFLAEGGTGMGHRETVARSRSLMGPYTPSPYGPVIRQWDERALIQRCGHAKPVMTPDGRWYFVYLCGRALDGQWTMLGRETALDPFTWTPDGWPLLNEGRGVSTLCRMPLPPQPFERERTDWVTPRPPQPGTIQHSEDGVTICGGEFPLSDVRCRSLTLRRQTAFACSFSAVLTVPDAEQGEAGVTGYYDEYSFYTVGVRRTEGGCMIRVAEQISHEYRVRYEQAIDVQPGQQITLSTQANGLVRNVSWSTHPSGTTGLILGKVTYLSDEGVTVSKRFTGAMLGVYATGCTASFSGMTYTEGTGDEA